MGLPEGDRPRGGIDYPRAWGEFQDWFRGEAECIAYLERLRWGAGYRCPSCSGDAAWRTRRGLWVCRACRQQTSVTARTIFDKTRTPLRTWFAAAWYVTNQKLGVSALGLQQAVDLGTYETVWTHLHKLRRAMVRRGRDRLTGRVEVDETYVGGDDGRGGRSIEKKALLAIAVASEPGRGITRVRMEVIPDATQASLEPFVQGAIAPGATVKTDAWGGYNRLRQLGYDHQIVNLSNTLDPAHVVMPDVHRVASLLKRWILGTHQGSVALWHMPYYLDEYTFRFNRRSSRHRGLLFFRLLQQAVDTAPTTLDQIREPGRSVIKM